MKLRKQLLTAGAALVLTVASSSIVFADNPQPDNPFDSAITSIATNVSAIKGYVEEVTNLMLQPPAELGNDLAMWQNMNALKQLQSNTTKSTSDSLSSVFQGQDTLGDTVQQAFKMDTSGSGDYSGLSAYSLLGLSHTKPTLTRPYDLYTATYNPDQAKAAKEYIGFLSGSAMAMVKPSGSTLQDMQQTNLYRTLAAVQSLDAYNLSKLYAERSPQLSTSAAHMDNIQTPEGEISTQGLVHYVLQNKVNNPDWYKQMSKASPFTVMREGVYLLAAGVSELYTIEQNQQQMILTQTANNTVTLAMAKQFMDQMQAANRAIDDAKQP